MQSTGGSERMEHEPKSIRYQSKKYPRLTTLINRVTWHSLPDAHEKQARGKAAGIDRVTKDSYEEKDLYGKVIRLVERMKNFTYYPQPVRRTYIPKANGKTRPLGIPAYEDKLVQSVLADILTEVYEPRFLDCSYGFRPGRSTHDVVRGINRDVRKLGINRVLEADIKGFFDNLDQKCLMKFLAHDIADKNFLRYIKRFLVAGVMEQGKIISSDKGTPQGGLISPILANVYLHYVLDLRVEKALKPQTPGVVRYYRYADDFVILFQREDVARKALIWVRERMSRFGLELAEEKTRILPIGPRTGTKEKFDFLGFTFLNGKTRKGDDMLCVITSEKKLKAKRQSVKEWLRTRLNQPIAATLRTINRAIQGHCAYYGVNGNYRKIRKFADYVKVSTLKMLRRRGQKHPMTWERFNEIWRSYVKPVRIMVDIWGWKPKMV